MHKGDKSYPGGNALKVDKALRLTIAGATCAATLALSVPIAQATTRHSNSGAIERSVGASMTETLAPYVATTAAGWSLNAPSSVLNSVPADQLDAIRKHIGETNALIVKGEMVMTPDGIAVPAVGVRPQLAEKRWKGQHGYIENHWYGWKLHLDSYMVSKLTGALSGSTALALLVQAVGATGPAFPIVVAESAFIIAEIQVCKSEKGDVNVYLVGVPPEYAVACNPF